MPDHAQGPGVPSAGSPAPLRIAGFRRLVLASGASSVGTGIQAVAIGWLALRLTGSAALLGVLALLALLPRALLSGLGGDLAARFGPRRMGVLLYTLRVVPPASLAVIAATGHLTYPELAGVALAGGVLGALAAVDLQDLLPGTVPDASRPRAIAIEAAVKNLAGLVGPLVGGAVLATGGAAWSFGLNAVSYVPVVVAIATTTVPGGVAVARRGHDHLHRFRLTGASRRADVRVLVVSAAAFSVLAAPVASLLSVVARHYDAGPAAVGYLLAALGAGGLMASVFLARLERRDVSGRHLLAASLVASGVSMMALAALGPFPAELAAVVAFGASGAVFGSVALSWVQLSVAGDEARTRVIGAYFGLNAACGAIGGVVLGRLFDAGSLAVATAGAGAVLVGLGLVRLLRRQALAGVRSATALDAT